MQHLSRRRQVFVLHMLSCEQIYGAYMMYSNNRFNEMLSREAGVMEMTGQIAQAEAQGFVRASSQSASNQCVCFSVHRYCEKIFSLFDENKIKSPTYL